VGIDGWADSNQLLWVVVNVRNLQTNIEKDISIKIDEKISLQESIYDHMEVKQNIWQLPNAALDKLQNN
jgi:hypothetical protein